MVALILLATIMALFGVLGYLRGVKSSLLTTAVIWLSVVLISQAREAIARTVNGLNFAVRFVLAGGLGALGGGGDRTAALEEVLKRVGTVKPLINPDGSGIGMLIVFLLFVAAGILLGALKFLRGKASPWGMLVGLAGGYAVSMFVLSRLAGPETAGPAAPASAEAASASPGVSFFARLATILNQLLESGQIALVISALILIFVLLATRLSARKK